MDELFEALTLIKTKKIRQFPIYLIGKSYWSGLIDWLKKTATSHHNIEIEDLDLLTITDDLDAVVNGIEAHYKKAQRLENF